MTTDTTIATTDATTAATTAPEGEQEQPKEIDWKAEARKHEARAKENAAKAKANEAAAQRLAEIEAADKTDAEKAAERIAAAEKRATDAEAAAIRAQVALDKNVPASLLSGVTQDELEASADALIAFRGEQKQTPSSTAISRVNSTTQIAPSPGRAFAEHIHTQLGH